MGQPAIESNREATPPPGQSGDGTTRAVLRWFGIDATGLDPTVPCSVCGLPAVIGGERCPSHLEEGAQAAILPGLRLGGVLSVALTLGLLGALLGVVAEDNRFAWMGALAAAAQVAAGIARQLRLGRAASVIGLLSFFSTLLLHFAGMLVAVIAALPLILEQML